MWIKLSEAKRRERVRREYSKEWERVQRHLKEAPPASTFTIAWGVVFMLLWISLWFL